MTATVRRALAVWNSRHDGHRRNAAFAVYMATLVVLVCVVPAVRAVFLLLTEQTAADALASANAPAWNYFVTALLFVVAPVLGQLQGPALLPPFLTHALAGSDASRVAVYGRPVARSLTMIVGSFAGTATLVAVARVVAGNLSVSDVWPFVAAWSGTGVTLFGLWLGGQVYPKAAARLSLGTALLSVAGLFFPALRAVVPWGWTTAAYSTGVAAVYAAACAVGLAALVLALVPGVLARVGLDALLIQSARWDSVFAHLTSMELGGAAAAYRVRPSRRGRWSAVVPVGRLWVTIARREIIGACRTPGRLAFGAVAVAVSGMLVTFAVSANPWGLLLGATAGLSMFVGLGPLTDGLRHAVDVAGDLPLYGVSDGRLVLYHLLVPLGSSVLVASCAALAVGWNTPGVAGPAFVSTLLLACLALAVRLATALKGPMPLELLTPIPSPVGDPLAVVRVAWAADGLFLSALAGVAAVGVGNVPFAFIAVAVVLGGVTLGRWWRRR